MRYSAEQYRQVAELVSVTGDYIGYKVGNRDVLTEGDPEKELPPTVEEFEVLKSYWYWFEDAGVLAKWLAGVTAPNIIVRWVDPDTGKWATGNMYTVEEWRRSLSDPLFTGKRRETFEKNLSAFRWKVPSGAERTLYSKNVKRSK